jgi:hypothetical protein
MKAAKAKAKGGEDEYMNKRMLVMIVSAVSLISMATGAVAATSSTKIQAFLDGSMKFKINGVQWKPTDASGKAIQPISYNGTTYLPVRAVSDAFGTPIKYDGASKTISIGAGDAVGFNSSGIKPKYKPYQFQEIVDRSKLQFGDKTYSGAYSMPAYTGTAPNDFMSFQFDGKYQKLHLVVAGSTDLKFKVANLEEQVLASDLTVTKDQVSEYDIDLLGSNGIIIYPYEGKTMTDSVFYLLKDSWVK